jgi:hypothetical protein
VRESQCGNCDSQSAADYWRGAADACVYRFFHGHL